MLLLAIVAPVHGAPPEGKGPNRTLTVVTDGTGTGTITSSPAGIDCGTSCSASFKRRTLVTLTATPASDSVFSGWSAAECTGTGSCAIELTTTTTVTASFSLKPHLVVSLTTNTFGITQPGQWRVASGFIQHFNPLQVQAIDASGAPVTAFSGTVALSSSCPLATEGGDSHTYTSADGGSHTFSVGLGDNVAFGATIGVYPPDSSTPGVVCTVTATDTTSQATSGSQDLRAAGEFCDNVDNNANVSADEGHPEKGSMAPDGGTYVCSTDGMTVISSQTTT